MAIQTKTAAVAASTTERCQVLLQAATPEIYRSNAFRLLGLPVNSSTRQINRRKQEMAIWEKTGEYPKDKCGPLPVDSPPESNHLRMAFQKIHGPYQRLLDELFWFWPEQFEATEIDDALIALMRGDDDSAMSCWNDQKARGDGAISSAIASHNLAVFAHTRALDFELLEAECGHSKKAIIAQQKSHYWNLALYNWRLCINSEDMWRLMEERALYQNDPSLTIDLVNQLRTTLPIAIIHINAVLALQSAERKDDSGVKKHLDIMSKSGFDSDVIEEALKIATEPMRERIKLQCDLTKEKSDQDSDNAEEVTRQLLEQISHPLFIIDTLFKKGSRHREYIHDEIALTLHSCPIELINKTEDWLLAKELLKSALGIAEGRNARQRIEASLKTAEENHSAGLCWFCGEEQSKDSAAIKKDMYGDVNTERYLTSTRTTWRHLTVEVPRCSKCKSAHSWVVRLFSSDARDAARETKPYSDWKQYSQIQERLENGWEFGQSPQ